MLVWEPSCILSFGAGSIPIARVSGRARAIVGMDRGQYIQVIGTRQVEIGEHGEHRFESRIECQSRFKAAARGPDSAKLQMGYRGVAGVPRVLRVEPAHLLEMLQRLAVAAVLKSESAHEVVRLHVLRVVTQHARK